jgi:hypothetical protein
MYLIKPFILIAGISAILFGHPLHAQQSPVDFLTDSVTYIWPTDASPYLSSTFAETRSAHLHSGIDIRTWGREGYRVFAARDGEVYRIGMGPSGYGNVIYLRHNDGSFTVYAHLNRFEPGLQSYADSIRLIDFRFELDRHVSDTTITYSQGDVIGYTGSTGVGPPHLHFEIRSPEYIPVNPLLSNLSVTDNLPPVFSQIAVEYLESNSLRRKGHSILPVNSSGDNYDFGEITVSGPFGLAVNVHDRANRTPNVYAVHSLKLVMDSDTLFHASADHFNFSAGGNMFLDRSYPILSQTRRGYQRLYRVSGNRLPFYIKTLNEGVLNLPAGTHKLQIIAKDIYGNESRSDLTVHSENEDLNSHADISYVPAYPSFTEQNPYPLYRWNADRKTVSNILLASASSDLIYNGNPFKQPIFVSADRRSARKKLMPNRFAILHTADQKLWLQFPSESLYDSLDVKVNISANSANGDLSISFTPTDVPLNKPAILNLILPENIADSKGLALYSVDPHRDRESFLSSTISNGILKAELSRIRDLKLTRDLNAPWVGRAEFRENLAGNHILIIPAVDNGSGINYRRSTILVNGKRGIVEYNPDRDWLIYYHPDFTPSADNSIEYEIFDGAGNSKSATLNLSYR